MKRIDILHVIPQEKTEILQAFLSHWPGLFDADRFKIHIATFKFRDQKNPEPREDVASPIHRFNQPWRGGAAQLRDFIRQNEIAIMHTHLEPATTWAVYLGKLFGIKLFAHNYLGGRFLPRYPMLSETTPWKHFHAISLDHEQLLGLFKRKPFLDEYRLFINPFSLPGHLYHTLGEDGVFSHFMLNIEDYQHSESTIPTELKEAFQKVKDHFPQTIIKYRNQDQLKKIHQNTHPNKKDAMPFYVLISSEKNQERVFLRYIDLMTQGIPVLLIGDHSFLPMALREEQAWMIPYKEDLITESLLDTFNRPELFLEVVNKLQKTALKKLNLERHCELWRLRYETLIEESTEKTLTSLKRPFVLGRNTAPGLSDERFLSLLVCPLCHEELTLDATDHENGRVFTGELNCACGSKYPIIEGIPRLDQKPAVSKEANAYYTKYFEPKLRQQSMDCFEQIQQNDLVLDLSCSNGTLLKRLSRHGISGVGLVQESELNEAKANLRDHPQLRLVVANATKPPFKSNSFDACFNTMTDLKPKGFTLNQEGPPSLSNPAKDIQTWQNLLNRDGRLMLMSQKLPFTMKNHQDVVYFLRQITTYFPLFLIHAFTGVIAFAQLFYCHIRFRHKPIPSFTHFHALWFRLLTVSDLHLPTERELREWGNEAGLNLLELKRQEPYGYILKGSR